MRVHRIIAAATRLVFLVSLAQPVRAQEPDPEPQEGEAPAQPAAQPAALDIRSDPAGIRIDWRAPLEAAGRPVELQLVRDGAVVTSLAVDLATFVDAEADPATLHSYEVRARFTAGGEPTLWTGRWRPLPLAPRSVEVRATTDHVALTWTHDTRAGIEFEVWRRRNGATTAFDLVGRSATASFIDRPGDWEYQVVAVDDGVRSPSVATPRNLTATESPTRVRLRWADVSHNERGFRVERAVGDGPFEQLVSTVADQTEWDDEKLEPSTSYRYRVIAVRDADAESLPTSPLRACTSVPPKPVLDALVEQSRDHNVVLLRWATSPGAAHAYRVERRTAGEDEFEEVAEVDGDTSTYSDADVEGGRSYEYRVVALPERQTSTSNTERITVWTDEVLYRGFAEHRRIELTLRVGYVASEFTGGEGRSPIAGVRIYNNRLVDVRPFGMDFGVRAEFTGYEYESVDTTTGTLGLETSDSVDFGITAFLAFDLARMDMPFATSPQGGIVLRVGVVLDGAYSIRVENQDAGRDAQFRRFAGLRLALGDDFFLDIGYGRTEELKGPRLIANASLPLLFEETTGARLVFVAGANIGLEDDRDDDVFRFAFMAEVPFQTLAKRLNPRLPFFGGRD